MVPRTLLTLPLGWLLVGCGTPDDAGGGPADPPTLDDADGDGLDAASELAGTTILVNTSGRPSLFETREVTSDPDLADTDGDGLDDLDERTYGTDPRAIDTDGDGLDDHEEIHRWGTSPTAVDSDGDAVGDGSTAPIPDLFDGAELQLETAADGTRWAGVQATSPLLADSDGDGANDHSEHLSPTRSPVLAERPEIRVRMAPGTSMDASLNYVRGESLTVEDSYTTSTQNSDVASSTYHAEGALATSNYVEVAFGRSYQADVGVSTESLGVDVSAEAWAELSFGQSATVATTLAMDQTHRAERTSGWASTETELAEETWAFDSGTLAMVLEVTNTGPLAFTFANLAVPVSTLAPGAELATRPLTVLLASDGSPSTLAPGDSVLVLVEDEDVDPTRMLELFGATAVQLAPSSWDLLDQDGIDFDYAFEDVVARTTSVEVDDGEGGIRQYFLATDIARTPDGGLLRPTVAEVLERVGVEATSHVDEPVITYTVDGVPTLPAHGPGANFTTLDPLGYPVTGGVHEVLFEQAWFLFLDRGTRESPEVDQDVLQLDVGPGDRIVIGLARDLDRDGILDLEEGLHGSSDEALDTDGDGLSDFWELREGGVVTTDFVSFETWSSPAAADSDGDGLDDLEEFELGLSPLHVDTDGDGYSDAFELDDPSLDPLRFDLVTVPIVTCVVDGYCGSVHVEVFDAEGDVAELSLALSGRMDAVGTGPYCPTLQNLELAAGTTFDPPLVATWSSQVEGVSGDCPIPDDGSLPFCPDLTLTSDPSSFYTDLVATAGWAFLTEGPACTQPVTMPDTCTYSFADVALTLEVTAIDLQGHTTSATCTVETP